MQNNINYELEAYLELIALRFLNIVDEEGSHDETLSLVNELVDQIIRNKNDIFNRIPATGNYGIALHRVLAHDLIQGPSKKLTVRLVSYWTISNHIKQDPVPLLRYSRALGLYSDRKLFYETYKKTITSDPDTIDYQVEISTLETTVNMLFMHDLYLIKDNSDRFNQVYKTFEREFGIPLLGFNSNEYYDELHEMLMNVISGILLNKK